MVIANKKHNPTWSRRVPNWKMLTSRCACRHNTSTHIYTICINYHTDPHGLYMKPNQMVPLFLPAHPCAHEARNHGILNSVLHILVAQTQFTSRDPRCQMRNDADSNGSKDLDFGAFLRIRFCHDISTSIADFWPNLQQFL